MLDPMQTAAIDPAQLRPEDRAERLFAGAIWAAMSLALLAYVGWSARNIPYMEDWDLVPVLTGATPFSLSWLFEPTQEHRFVLGRLVLYWIFQLSDGDFRGAMWISALILICLAYAFQRAARSLRGHAAFTDALFPVALLHWGHHENLFFFVQLWFVLPVMLFCIAALAIVTGWWQKRGGMLTLVACVLLLPLNGGVGLLLAPALAAWMAYAAWTRRATPSIAWAMALPGIFAILFAAFYFLRLQSPAQIAKVPRPLGAILRTTFEVLGASFGPGAPGLWLYLGLVVAGLCTATAFALFVLALRNRGERLRATGLFACLVSAGLIAFGIGYGRSIVGPGAGSVSRYCLLMIPALCVVYLTAVVYAGSFRSRLVQMTLFVVACAMFSINVQSGIAYAHYRNADADAMLAGIAGAMPPRALAQRYFRAIYPNPDALAQRLAMLQLAQVGPYSNVDASALAPAPACHDEQMSTQVVASNDVEFGAESARGLGTDPFVVYALPRLAKVCGIRIHYIVENSAGVPPVTTQVFWALSAGHEHFDGTRRNVVLTLPPGEQTQTFWVYSTIDQFRFDPDVRQCTFRVIDVTFLVED
jgi:hypothetical protein